MNEYRKEREQQTRRRRTVARAVSVVVAVGMLGSLVIPALYAGL
ncbi:hypothetical protein [Bifidobacterium callimiconis]|nr:hypothetical protein [Bifidobacterium callimiconis]